MPTITNLSAFDVSQIVPKENTVLIRIGDYINPYFPQIQGGFHSVHTFCFDDTLTDGDESISEQHAKDIANVLKDCLTDDRDILVHCFAGICRSGAVVECGVVLGFEDGGAHRQPNVLVKHKIFKALGFEMYENE